MSLITAVRGWIGKNRKLLPGKSRKQETLDQATQQRKKQTHSDSLEATQEQGGRAMLKMFKKVLPFATVMILMLAILAGIIRFVGRKMEERAFSIRTMENKTRYVAIYDQTMISDRTGLILTIVVDRNTGKQYLVMNSQGTAVVEIE